jgi:hypothetical protein
MHGIMAGASIEQQKDLVKTLSVEQLNIILPGLDIEILSTIPVEYLNSLNLTREIYKPRLQAIIGTDTTRCTQALQILSADKIESLLPQLDSHQLGAIPLDLFKKMQKTNSQIKYFPGIIGHAKERMAEAFAIISTQNLQSILEKLSKEQLEAIPLDRLKDLKLAHLPVSTFNTLIGESTERYQKTLHAFSLKELRKFATRLSGGADRYYKDNIQNKP